jgi:hypothetical protein
VKTRLGWDDNSINIDEVAERLWWYSLSILR